MTKDLHVKHPLQNTWSLWFFKNDKSKSWANNLRKITNFDTVEDFWSIYNHIQVASKIGLGCDYSLFKVSKICQTLSPQFYFVDRARNHQIFLKFPFSKFCEHGVIAIAFESQKSFRFCKSY